MSGLQSQPFVIIFTFIQCCLMHRVPEKSHIIGNYKICSLCCPSWSKYAMPHVLQDLSEQVYIDVTHTLTLFEMLFLLNLHFFFFFFFKLGPSLFCLHNHLLMASVSRHKFGCLKEQLLGVWHCSFHSFVLNII
jgi:uncharacterized membrane protein